MFHQNASQFAIFLEYENITNFEAQTSIYFWRLCCCVFLKNVISISISWHFSGCWNVLSKNTYTTKKGIYKALVIDRTFGLAELMGTTISQSFVKIGSKTKIFITRTFFVNKQLTLFFNFLQNASLNFAQNFRECLFKLAGSESGEKSKRAKFFVYISQLFVYKTRLWT